MATRFVVTSSGVTECLLRNRARMARLQDLRPEMEKASELIYEHTARWFDSRGEGTWPDLADSTVAGKVSQGYAEPERPLYAEGNLRESVTSPSGPYSSVVYPHDGVVVSVDWDVGGWQIPVVLSEGTTTAGVGHTTVIPPRPIWPVTGSQADLNLRKEVGDVIMKGVE